MTRNNDKNSKSLAHRDGNLEANEAADQPSAQTAMSRRDFLQAAGFTLSLVAMSGCDRAPKVTALPFVTQPEGMVPGRTQQYASICAGCPAACGLLAGVRDGRPLKMEGMPEHPLSRGGLCGIGQALPLGLYDSHRLTQPLADGQPADWNDVDNAITQKLRDIDDNGGTIRFVTSTVTSPTLKASIDAFLGPYTDAKHVTFDAVSCSAILDAHEKTHAARVLPHFKLDSAKVIVSFGADFLGTWISPVEFTAAWQTRRVPTEDHPEMSYHVQLEGRLSLTGGNADRRYRVSPTEYGTVLNHLATKIAKRAQQSPPAGAIGSSAIADPDIEDMANRLWRARGESVVLCDSQDVTVQILVNFINQTLGNYGRTVDIERPSRQRQGNDRDVLALVEELKAGQVSALFVAGTDLTHNLPDRAAMAEAIGKATLVVSFAERVDDFASLANFVCPDHHPLESWMDAEPISGLVSIAQPTLHPLGETRSILESLARWSGSNESAYDILRSTWNRNILPRVESQPFQSFWDKAVHDGFVETSPAAVSASEFQAQAVTMAEQQSPGDDYALVLYSKVGLTDSRHAHNPWLQELPDPTTKVTWDNYVCVSPATAKKLSLTDGDLVRVATREDNYSVELPALVQRGQHDAVVAIALGYGVRGTDRFSTIGPQWLESRPTVAPGERVGKNVAGFIEAHDGELHYAAGGVTLTKTGGRRDLASTQEHHTLELPRNVAPRGAKVRNIVQKTTLAEFEKNPEAGAPHMHPHPETQLWAEDHPKDLHHWGLVVDLNKCTGCSACLIACQSENNVPVVGKDEVRRQREMHWIRLDRYYSGDDDDVDVSHQPMMCHHCDNAPCETVCPVLATVHGTEGLNEQVYNRCVGTRYCANNCPYKVRRFNWFKYEREDPLQNLVLNPDVTVRTRGVMEKCSMCVQRIEEGKIAARQRDEPVADGQIQTACQQSCPAQAIVFGDMNDSESSVHHALEDPRQYRVLEEFNFRPSVAYLRVVKNRDDEHQENGHA